MANYPINGGGREARNGQMSPGKMTNHDRILHFIINHNVRVGVGFGLSWPLLILRYKRDPLLFGTVSLPRFGGG